MKTNCKARSKSSILEQQLVWASVIRQLSWMKLKYSICLNEWQCRARWARVGPCWLLGHCSGRGQEESAATRANWSQLSYNLEYRRLTPARVGGLIIGTIHILMTQIWGFRELVNWGTTLERRVEEWVLVDVIRKEWFHLNDTNKS